MYLILVLYSLLICDKSQTPWSLYALLLATLSHSLTTDPLLGFLLYRSTITWDPLNRTLSFCIFALWLLFTRTHDLQSDPTLQHCRDLRSNDNGDSCNVEQGRSSTNRQIQLVLQAAVEEDIDDGSGTSRPHLKMRDPSGLQGCCSLTSKAAMAFALAPRPLTRSTVQTRVLDKSVGRSSVEEIFELIDLSDY